MIEAPAPCNNQSNAAPNFNPLAVIVRYVKEA